jgi:hypothetical protein
MVADVTIKTRQGALSVLSPCSLRRMAGGEKLIMVSFYSKPCEGILINRYLEIEAT